MLGACPAESQQQDTPPALTMGACPAESQRRSLRPEPASGLCGFESFRSQPRRCYLSSLARRKHAAPSHTRDHQHTNTHSTTTCCSPATEQRERHGQDVTPAGALLTWRGECPTLTRTGRLWASSVSEKKKKDVPLTSSREQTEAT